jgi:hypothetical protein
MTENPLMKIPVITKAILDAQPLTIHSEQLNHLEGLRFMADKIDAERFSIEYPRGGNGSNQYGKKEQKVSRQTLADCGFNKSRANMCRRIAAIPEEMFEAEIIEIRKDEHKTDREISIQYFSSIGYIHQMRMKGINTDKPYSAPEDEIDVEFAEFMFWYGVEWEGGVNASPRCNVNAEIKTAIEAWKEYKEM